MTDSSHTRTNIVAFLAILALSAATMLWLFWHFPVITTLVTVAILAALDVSGRLSRSIDGDLTDMQQGKQSF
jgi:hypothetical protein